jgi:hypothetical protein
MAPDGASEDMPGDLMHTSMAASASFGCNLCTWPLEQGSKSISWTIIAHEQIRTCRRIGASTDGRQFQATRCVGALEYLSTNGCGVSFEEAALSRSPNSSLAPAGFSRLRKRSRVPSGPGGGRVPGDSGMLSPRKGWFEEACRSRRPGLSWSQVWPTTRRSRARLRPPRLRVGCFRTGAAPRPDRHRARPGSRRSTSRRRAAARIELRAAPHPAWRRLASPRRFGAGPSPPRRS